MTLLLAISAVIRVVAGIYSVASQVAELALPHPRVGHIGANIHSMLARVASRAVRDASTVEAVRLLLLAVTIAVLLCIAAILLVISVVVVLTGRAVLVCMPLPCVLTVESMNIALTVWPFVHLSRRGHQVLGPAVVLPLLLLAVAVVAVVVRPVALALRVAKASVYKMSSPLAEGTKRTLLLLLLATVLLLDTLLLTTTLLLALLLTLPKLMLRRPRVVS